MGDSISRILTALALAALPVVGYAQTAAQPPAPASAPPPAPPPKKTVEGVTVTAGQPDVQTSIDRKSFTLGKDLMATTGSIADALRNVPSVEVDLQGNLSLRGDPNVTILVDGKPAPQFEGQGRADALQQLAADQYERVEVITNPSAALNPEGSGGVINLITKKSHGAGITGAAYVNVASAGLKREGASFGYNSQKLSVTASVAGNYQRNKDHSEDFRGGPDPSTGVLQTTDDHSIGRNLTRGPSGRLNLSYAATEKDQVTLALTANQLNIEGHPQDNYVDAMGGVPTGVLDRIGDRRFHELDPGVTAGWKHSFAEGRELSIDLVDNVSEWREHYAWQTTVESPAAAAPFEAIQNNGEARHEEVRLNYAQPIGGATLKAGYELKADDNAYRYSDAQGPAPEALTLLPALANDYVFHQLVDDVYLTYERPLGDLVLLAGLRVDDDRLDLHQLSEGRTDRQAYTKLFPTLHLTWKLDDDRKLSASFSERIERPRSLLLNPRIYVNDPLNLQVGNPQLKPQITQAYELGYEQKAGKTDIQATLYYRDNVGAFTPVEKNLGNGVFEQTFGNLGGSRFAGVEAVVNGALGKALTYNVSSNLYWNEIYGQNTGLTAQRAIWGASGRANLNWQVEADDLIQLNAVVFGKRLYAQGASRPIYTANLGWRRKLTERLTATFTYQDVFASNHYRRTAIAPTYFDAFSDHPRIRYIFLRLDYRFGGGSKAAKDPGFEYENPAPPG